MAAVTYKVEWGDTLSEIALKYINNGVYSGKSIDEVVKILCDLNNIKDKDLIYAGQTLTISGSPNRDALNNGLQAKIKTFAQQSHNPNVLFAVWTWDRKHTASYQIRWKYKQANGTELYGNSTSIAHNENDPDASKYSTYEIPKDAVSVSFEVKPICSLEKENYGQYWAARWSTKKTYTTTPTPPKPEIKLDEYNDFTLIVEVKDIERYDNMPFIEFQLLKNNAYLKTTSKIRIDNADYAKYVFKDLSPDSTYRVRCRGARQNGSDKYYYSTWSELSDSVATAPAKPGGFAVCKATSETSVYLKWNKPPNTTAKTYNIEYTTNPDYFDVRPDDVTQVTGITMTEREISSNIETGKEYFFRLQAVNEDGKASPWSTNIKSIIIGKEPGAPTTWSSSTTAIVGEPLTLYWTHNSQDESDITLARLELYYDDSETPEVFVMQYSEDQDENDTTKTYELDTSTLVEGVQIRWRVKTAGITREYGEWSVDRYIDVYEMPTLELGVSNTLNGGMIDNLTSYPLYVSGIPRPNTQRPIGYYLSVFAHEEYETVDNIGNLKMVNAGEEIFSQYYDISDVLSVVLSAGDINFENNITYTIRCVVAMDSGLEAENSTEFTVAWDEEVYWPDANILVDDETLAAHISPHCLDNDGLLIGDVVLSVYRREFDGRFTEIATNLENSLTSGVTDPHPALDYARYRIVATSKSTGAVSYYDQPGYPVNEKSVVLQWNETWSEFDFEDIDSAVNQTWTGSMLKLPYNIKISDSHAPDVSLIEYIGREHPVSYYGTQVGETSTWSVEINREDKETIYALRRLAKWMGNVYVREPSGSGYWANVTVSFSRDHDKLTVPVTLDIKRVEGGI